MKILTYGRCKFEGYQASYVSLYGTGLYFNTLSTSPYIHSYSVLSASDICWLETFIIMFVPERFDIMRNEGYYKMRNLVIYTGHVDLWQLNIGGSNWTFSFGDIRSALKILERNCLEGESWMELAQDHIQC